MFVDLPRRSGGVLPSPASGGGQGLGTCVHPVVGLQLVLQAELLPAAVTFVGLLPGVDALVALQRVLVSEAAPAELALVRMVACCKVQDRKRSVDAAAFSNTLYNESGITVPG